MSTEQITPESLTEKQKILSKLEAIRKAKGGGDNFDDAVRQLLDILETGRQQLEFDHKFYQEYVKKLVKKYIAGKGGVANKVDAEFILISFGLLERYNGTGLENAWRRFAKGKKESLKENAPTWLVNNDIKSFYRHRSILLEQLAADIDYAIENGKWVSLLNADSPENGLPAKDQPSEKSGGSDDADKSPEPPSEAALSPAGDKPQSKPPAVEVPQEPSDKHEVVSSPEILPVKKRTIVGFAVRVALLMMLNGIILFGRWNAGGTSPAKSAVIQEIFVFNDEISLLPGESELLRVGIYPHEADIRDINCTTRDPQVATVRDLQVTAYPEWQKDAAHSTIITVQAGYATPVDVSVNVEEPDAVFESGYLAYSGGMENDVSAEGELEAASYE